MSAEIDPRDFGRLEAEVQQLQDQVAEIASDMKAVRSVLDAAGGSWRTLVGVAAATSAVTAFLVKLFPSFPWR
jgi:hypothetical protein